MKVALTVWEDRISPVFDSARTLLVVEIKDQEIVNRFVEKLNYSIFSNLAQMVSCLNLLKIDVLICGAISQIPANMIEASGIELIPFISGNTEEIIATYSKDKSIIPMFLMPGCGLRHCRNNREENFIDMKEVRTMPRRDGTGPQGQGAGVGRGFGRGGCRGGKMGAGFGSGYGAPQYAYNANTDDELVILKQRAESAKNTLDSISARIAELEKPKD